MRLFAAFVLLALAVLAIPGPHALAQPPARPEPQELWQQFPLEQESAPPGSLPTSPTTAEEGDRSRTVAIAVTVGLLLLLMIGLFAYVSRAQVALGREDVARRLRSAVATNGQKLGISARAGRRSLKRAGVRGLRGVRRLAANVRKPTVPASAEAAAKELARVKEMLATYVASGPAERSADKHVEKLKAKLEVQLPTSGTGRHEVEILKAKQGEHAGSRDAGVLDEAETLKAKLTDNAVVTEGETETPIVLEAKPVERGPTPKTRPRNAAGVASKHRHKQLGQR